jgi:hypothetical protein
MDAAIYSLMADTVVVLHLVFVLFAVFGGLLILRWRRLLRLHLLAVLWATLLELFGWGCPLTPLENYLRQLAGKAVYGTGFLEHYLLPLLYPGEMTRAMQLGLALLVVTVNVAVYRHLWRHGYLTGPS